ncbi:MAG: GntR family transcriptional regulator [Paraglaciecola sp.]|uniref:GntR family transcriptional regulator n=1 Tax=Paraglaciecola sp. TaxID=1920173 RepID=UPI003298978A
MVSPEVVGLKSPLIGEEDSVYSRILADISSAIFVSGDRLVTTALAKRYSTSINPVREALNRLQGEGLVTVSVNSGARVTYFEYRTMRDVFEILQLIEPYLMEWFVHEHTVEQRQHLYHLMHQMERLEESEHLSYRILDTQFHWAMYSQHYNTHAVELWRKNRLVLQTMHANLSSNKSRASQSMVEHRAIMRCLEQRDADGTLAILQNHITNSRQYWSRYIDDQPTRQK